MAFAIVPSAARTTSDNSGNIDADGAMVALLVNVAAASGTTPTLDMSVEWSHDGSTFAAADPADVFTQITTAVAKVKRFTCKGGSYRLVWSIGGTTPSFTFDVSALETSA